MHVLQSLSKSELFVAIVSLVGTVLGIFEMFLLNKMNKHRHELDVLRKRRMTELSMQEEHVIARWIASRNVGDGQVIVMNMNGMNNPDVKASDEHGEN